MVELKRLCKELIFWLDFLGEFEREIVVLVGIYLVIEFVVYIGFFIKVNYWILFLLSL